MPTKIIGTAPYQVPRNSDLGTIAVQDLDNVSIQGGAIALNASTTQGYFQNTDVSDIKPTLMLDFANAKSLDARVSFARSTSATYYDGRGCIGEQNMLTNSENFLSWSLGNASVFTNGLAPDGISSSSKFVETAVAGYHYVSQSVWVGTAQTVTFSLYAKAEGRTQLHVQMDQGTQFSSDRYAIFNLGTGAITSTQANTTSSIVSVGGGWYRCVITATMSGTGAVTCKLLSYNGTTINYTGDGSSGVYIWGAQFEQRNGASTYVKTTTFATTNSMFQMITASNDQPRFDHDPITGECKGLLIEGAATNLCPYSSAIISAFSNVANVAYETSGVAPDGTLSAVKLTRNTGASGDRRVIWNSSPYNGTYVYSVYVKSAGDKVARMHMWNSGAGGTRGIGVNLLTGAVVSISGSLINYGCTDAGNGWWRLWFATTVENISYSPLMLYPGNSEDAGTTGDGFSGTLFWGVQVETVRAGAEASTSTPSSYIPTNGASATRNTDQAWCQGTNFSSWYNPKEGTMFASFKAASSGLTFPQVFTISDGSTNMCYNIDVRNGIRGVGTTNSGNSSFSMSFTNSGDLNNAALAYSNYNNAFSLNGSLPSSSAGTVDTTLTVPPNMVYAGIGNFNMSQYPLGGTIKKIAYYPKRLSNAELAEITL